MAQPSVAGIPLADLLILIHGYNTTKAEAEDLYKRFQEQLVKLLGGGLGRAGEVWEFHWPGDHPSSIISMFSYGARVPVATKSGEHLAHYLANELKSHQTVNIVAHSLGCRVALSAIREVRQLRERGAYRGAKIGQVFLLAAAVPVPFCTMDAPEYSEPFPGSSEHVFYSRRDFILLSGFCFGQGSYGEPGPAVGRNGEPVDRWSTRSDMHIGHTRYWSASHVARAISAGFKPAWWRRDLPRRWLPESGAGVESRTMPPQHVPASEVDRRRTA